MTNTIPEFSAHKFREIAKDALLVSSAYIKDAIEGNVDLSDYLIKGDKTAVTVVDRKSQALATPHIRNAFPEYRLNQEETKGETGNQNSNIILYHDPLDGTGGFLIGGPTPTVILGAYDSVQEQVLACATMEPTTGRMWFSAKGEGAWLNRFDYSSEQWTSEDGHQIRVNDHEGLKGSHVLVDINHAFSRLGGTKPILYMGGRRDLTNQLEMAGAKEASMYTNGGHFALVATGRPTLVGNITTAIGGPFDIVGLLHVTEAGGVARCYSINSDPKRHLSSGQIFNHNHELIDDHNIKKADMVIAANNLANLKTLEEALQQAVTHKI